MAAQSAANLLDGLGVNLVQLLAQVVNFLLIMYFLNGVVIRPILRNLEARRKRIEDSLEHTRLADERLAHVEKDYQSRLNEASAEAQKLRADVHANTQAEVRRIRADAEAEAEAIKAQASIDALSERNQVLGGARDQIVSLVMAATDKLVGASLDADRHKALIDDFFTKVPAAGVDGMTANGAPVWVTSALPLTPDEQASVKAELSKQVGTVDAIRFNVDPGILGGLVVRIGDKVIDGSVAGKIDAMRRQLM